MLKIYITKKLNKLTELNKRDNRSSSLRLHFRITVLNNSEVLVGTYMAETSIFFFFSKNLISKQL